MSRRPVCVSLVVLTLVLAGCSSGGPAPSPSTPSVDESTKEAEIARREADLARREADLEMQRKADELARREAEVAERERAAVQAPVPKTAPAPSKPSAPATAPQAQSAPAPKTVTLSVPAGTQLDVELLDPLSSGTSQVGDRFQARLASPLSVNGRVLAPAGAKVSGVVTEVVSLKKFGGQAKLVGAFDSIVIDGTQHAIHATVVEQGKKQAGKDAAKIGGAAVAGAILGHQVDGDHGKEIGGLVGGAIGTAVAAKTGKELEVPAGTRLTVALEQPLSIEVPE